MNGLRHHDAAWLAPSPLWGPALLDADSLDRPTILRFASDSFMDEFMATLSYDPGAMAELVAQPETWRGVTPQPASASLMRVTQPAAPFEQTLERWLAEKEKLPETPQAVATAGETSETAALKLYQPAHRRYYLAAASLTCKTAGVPDRKLNTAAQDQVTLVVRRLVNRSSEQPPRADDEDTMEYALVATARGQVWQEVGENLEVVSGEEQLPLFSIETSAEQGARRRIFAGLIPVSNREAYTAAPLPAAGDESAEVQPNDPRMIVLQMEVVQPWKSLIERAESVAAGTADNPDLRSIFDLDPPPAGANDSILKDSRDQIQTVSWYVLLDFSHFLETYLENVWLLLNASPATEATGEEQALFDALNDVSGLAEALRDIRLDHDLEGVEIPYDSEVANADWPSFEFPLADPESAPLLTADAIDELVELARLALPADPAGHQPAPSAVLPNPNEAEEAWFAIRFIYERAGCYPFALPVVSRASATFQLAGFFDPDAPVRPVRLALPVDITPAGLRKHNKGAGLMISSLLCGHLERIKKITFADLVLSVLPWPFHKDLPSITEPGPCKDGEDQLGMVCSLSIPIVTLCAIILLIIMVSLFDYFFRWLPYLFTCFPLPGFKGKEAK